MPIQVVTLSYFANVLYAPSPFISPFFLSLLLDLCLHSISLIPSDSLSLSLNSDLILSFWLLWGWWRVSLRWQRHGAMLAALIVEWVLVWHCGMSFWAFEWVGWDSLVVMVGLLSGVRFHLCQWRPIWMVVLNLMTEERERERVD